VSHAHNTRDARLKPKYARCICRYAIAPILSARMDDDDDIDGSRMASLRARLPYAIGFCGLLAWFALLYFMLRDAL
jgi:hypothetical protein